MNKKRCHTLLPLVQLLPTVAVAAAVLFALPRTVPVLAAVPEKLTTVVEQPVEAASSEAEEETLPKLPYADGVYVGSSRGYGGAVRVQVTMENGSITEVEILDAPHETKQFLRRAKRLLTTVVDAQSWEVDAVSEATYTLMAAGVVPYGDPMNIGMLGMHGCYTSNRAVADCDVLIAVGTRFSDRVALKPKTFAKNATIIQIDIDPSELGKNVEVDLSIVGDAAYVLQAMLPQIKEAKHPDWMKMIHEWQAQDYHPVSDPTHLMPHQVIGEVCNQCGPEAVYVTDVGQHQMWAAQYLRHAKSRGFITSGGLGTMGFGYGAAIGAQMALGRDQRVVMFTGDGSFHMNLNEACTAVSYDLPIITVIFNNSVLGMVRQWQTTFYGKRYSQTDPHRHTDFVKLAEGFGLKGCRCTNLPEFQQAFAEALQRKGPTWIECIIDKDEKVLPMIPGGGDINDIIME